MIASQIVITVEAICILPSPITFDFQFSDQTAYLLKPSMKNSDSNDFAIFSDISLIPHRKKLKPRIHAFFNILNKLNVPHL